MKFNTILITLSIPIGLAAASLASNLQAGPVKGRYIVSFNEDVDKTTHLSWVDAVHKRNLAKRGIINGPAGIVSAFRRFNGYIGEFDDDTIAEINSNPDVDCVEADEAFDTTQVKSLSGRAVVTQTNTTYNLGSLSHRTPNHTEYIWNDRAGSGEDTYAYVIDSGIRTTHVEFEGRASLGYNYPAFEHLSEDEDGHGTHIAGSIGGVTFGVLKNTTLIGVRVSGIGPGSGAILLDGYDWAIDDIISKNRTDKAAINLSIATSHLNIFDKMLNNAFAQGVLSVVAAGNGGFNIDDGKSSPSSAVHALVVGNVDRDNVRYQGAGDGLDSNFGNRVDIFAAGANTLSVGIASDTETTFKTGTSMATPHIVGLALYLQQLEGLKGPQAVIDRIIELSTKGVIEDARGPNRLAYNGNGA